MHPLPKLPPAAALASTVCSSASVLFTWWKRHQAVAFSHLAGCSVKMWCWAVPYCLLRQSRVHVKKSYQKKIALNLFCRPSTGSHHGCASHRHPCLSGFETHTVHTYIVLGYFEMKKSQKFQENVKKGSFERGKGQSGREIFVPYPMVHSRGAKSAICVTQNIWHMSAFC